MMFEAWDKTEIRSISITDYHDSPISGWLRTKFGYFYFKTPDAFAYHRIYLVYYVKPKIKIYHLLDVRDFRNKVGWHQTRYPGRQRTYFSGNINSHSCKDYYNKQRLLPLKQEDLHYIGITDLESHVCWAGQLKYINKNLKYLDLDDED